MKKTADNIKKSTKIEIIYDYSRTTEFTWTEDSLEKFQNAIFFQDISNSFYWAADMSPEPHQKLF